MILQVRILPISVQDERRINRYKYEIEAEERVSENDKEEE
jgi:hypothetical protein